jgi:hypothetical protein
LIVSDPLDPGPFNTRDLSRSSNAKAIFLNADRIGGHPQMIPAQRLGNQL